MHQKWKFNTLRFDSYLIAASSILCSVLLKKKSTVLLEVKLLQICHSSFFVTVQILTVLIGTVFKVNFCSAGNSSCRIWHQIG